MIHTGGGSVSGTYCSKGSATRNAAHFHLIFNHVPVVLAVLVPLFLAWTLVRRGIESRRLAMGVTVLLGLTALPAFFSGEPAEGIVEHVPGISEGLIEPHEEAAKAAFIAVLVLGAAALAGLWYFRRSSVVPSSMVTALLLGSVVCASLMAWTANLGGKIHHSEITAAQTDRHR